MLPITETPNYKVSNVVLSQKRPFTISEVELELRRMGNELQQELIKKILDRLNDNGVVVKNGGSYSLSIYDF